VATSPERRGLQGTQDLINFSILEIFIMVPGVPLRERSSLPDPGGGMGGHIYYIVISDS
jgi:hypothetical protein